jgi:hypothetical protein
MMVLFISLQLALGVVLLAWKGTSCKILNSRVDSFSVTVEIVYADGSSWWFTGVYGPQSDELKFQFLQQLQAIRSLCGGPWVIGGDFNLIYRAEDKNNNNLNRAMMGRFQRLLNDLHLIELPLHGRKYT